MDDPRVQETSLPVSRQLSLQPGFTWRALFIGIILIPPNAYWIAQMERARMTAFPTVFSLFFNAVFVLLLLYLINVALRRFLPRFALYQSELLLIYSMLCISTAVSGIDFVQTLMPMFTYSFWMASPENKWDEILNPHMPEWLTVQDPSVIRGFYEGGASFYEPHVLAAWLGPVAMWTGFIMLLLLVLICTNVVLRRRWLDGEHLACPLISLPIQISTPQAGLFRRKLFWGGFALAASIEIWNSLAFYYPVMPVIPILEENMARHFTARPWNAVTWMPRSFIPFLVGLGYLMPSDFLFSCWFFYLFWKAELVFSAAFGLDQIKDFPFANLQGFGAYLLFAIYAIWLGRGYFRRLLSLIAKVPSQLCDEQEPLPYRVAGLGIVLGVAGLVWFTTAMGLRVSTSIAIFLIYYILALAITRMRAQFGTPVHDLHFSGPDVVLTSVFGSRSFARQELVGIGFLSWFNAVYRSHAMPHQMEAFKMQERTGGSQKGVVLALMLAGLVGTIAIFWSFLHIYYQLGAQAQGGRFNVWIYPKLHSWLTTPQGPEWGAAPAIGVGLAVAFFLQTMRMRYINWPFHPLGFAISGNYQMNHAWMPLLIAWIIKSAIIKYGGHKVYRRSVPVFLGFILADFVVISVLNLVSMALQIPCFRFVD